MPHEFARRSFTPVEGFRFDFPSHAPFLPGNAQGIALDTEIQGRRIDAGGESFYIYGFSVFVEVDQRVTPGCPARKKCSPESRFASRAILIKDSIDFPPQRF